MAKMILKDSLINLEGLTPNEVYLHSQALNFYKKCKKLQYHGMSVRTSMIFMQHRN